MTSRAPVDLRLLPVLVASAMLGTCCGAREAAARGCARHESAGLEYARPWEPAFASPAPVLRFEAPARSDLWKPRCPLPEAAGGRIGVEPSFSPAVASEPAAPSTTVGARRPFEAGSAPRRDPPGHPIDRPPRAV